MIQKLKETVKERDTTLQLNSDLIVRERQKAGELNEQVLDLEDRNECLTQRLIETRKAKDTFLQLCHELNAEAEKLSEQLLDQRPKEILKEKDTALRLNNALLDEPDIDANENKTKLKKEDIALDTKATALDDKEPLIKNIEEGTDTARIKPLDQKPKKESMTEGNNQIEASLDEQDIAREEPKVLDNSHSKGTELDNNQTEDKHFYKEDRDTPAHLTGKLRKDYEEPRSKIRVTVSKTRRARTLLKTQEKIESMSDDSLITAIKDHKRGDEAKILDL